jgi:hypothetical protein
MVTERATTVSATKNFTRERRAGNFVKLSKNELQERIRPKHPKGTLHKRLERYTARFVKEFRDVACDCYQQDREILLSAFRILRAKFGFVESSG